MWDGRWEGAGIPCMLGKTPQQKHPIHANPWERSHKPALSLGADPTNGIPAPNSLPGDSCHGIMFILTLEVFRTQFFGINPPQQIGRCQAAFPGAPVSGWMCFTAGIAGQLISHGERGMAAPLCGVGKGPSLLLGMWAELASNPGVGKKAPEMGEKPPLAAVLCSFPQPCWGCWPSLEGAQGPGSALGEQGGFLGCEHLGQRGNLSPGSQEGFAPQHSQSDSGDAAVTAEPPYLGECCSTVGLTGGVSKEY